MAKVILEHILAKRGYADRIVVDSAALCNPTLRNAEPRAVEAIKSLFGKDLLASHRSKSITTQLINESDLILAMERWQTEGLPKDKTFCLREFAGLVGEISDPYGKDLSAYIKCAQDIKECIEKSIEKIINYKEHQKRI
jgi:protein-tyrosine-phosphatase